MTMEELKRRLDNAIELQKQEVEYPETDDREGILYNKGFLDALLQIKWELGRKTL